MTAQTFTSSNEPEIAPYAAVLSITGLPSPILTDDPNVPRDMAALTRALDNRTVPVFATTAARDAARTAGATFVICYVLDVIYRWRGGAWVQMLDTVDLVPLPKGRLAHTPINTQTDVTSGNILTTSFTLPTARWVRVSTFVTYLQITAAATSTNMTLNIDGLGQRFLAGAATLNQTMYLPAHWVGSLTAGVHSALVNVVVLPGTARFAPATTFLTVEDIGA